MTGSDRLGLRRRGPADLEPRHEPGFGRRGVTASGHRHLSWGEGAVNSVEDGAPARRQAGFVGRRLGAPCADRGALLTKLRVPCCAGAVSGVTARRGLSMGLPAGAAVEGREQVGRRW